jgi:DNA-binding transcriptional ArsR family regulator
LVAKDGVKTVLSILTLPLKFLNALSVWAFFEERMRAVTDRSEDPEKGRDSRGRADLVAAIGHPLRRRILRLLRDSDDPRSPSKMAKALGEPLGTTAYHVRVLDKVGALEDAGEQQVRGAVESFFVSTIEDDPTIEALLEETREADEEAG